MRKVYTACEISADSIKIIILEKVKKKFFVLYADKFESRGVNRGLVVDPDLLSEHLEHALEETYKNTNIRINKVILTIAPLESSSTVISNSTQISNIDGIVTSYDLNESLMDAVNKKIDIKDELVMVNPVTVKVDGKKVDNPLGEKGEKLSYKAVASVMPKKYLYPYFNLFNNLSVEIVGICFSLVGDYYIAQNKNTNTQLGAVVNVSDDIIYTSIFNKGIMIKSDTIRMGMDAIEKDISYTYKIPIDKARYLKNEFIVATRKYADKYDTVELRTEKGGIVKISQEDIAMLVEKRILNIVDLIKTSIKNLTKKQIDYIIITGELTDLEGSSYILERLIDTKLIIPKLDLIGARENIYSSLVGSVYYFALTQEEKGLEYAMLSEDEINKIMNKEYEY